ncbi:MAG: pilus assembly protein TadG-related protein, partial [Candidatus Riflebacteria bacterium]|nr:pilus assembly protein TadG-related protein [Candidatus Riflebacteria bacterium]
MIKSDLPTGRSNLSNRTGGILVMAALASVFMISMLAMVTDISYIYYNQSRLQSATNAAWKAGYDRMMFLKGSKSALSDTEQAEVRAHMLEVMKANGYSDEELASVNIEFKPGNNVSINSKQTFGLFFARIMNFNSASVVAGRANHSEDVGAGIIPLAIPHGVTKDLTKNLYTCSLFPANGGFASGSEYILKLGSGNGGDAHESPSSGMLLVPMDAGAQDDRVNGFLRAYGAAFWCLRSGDGTDQGFVPVYWLLGYRGGSFMLPDHSDVRDKLKEYKVNYTIIPTQEEAQAIYDQVNPNVLELFDRPRVAVYSSQTTPDPVEEVLRAGKIPYGTYSLPTTLSPDGWQRSETYNESSNTRIYDTEILEGVLDNYHWVHLHHEDFTGFNGGCSYWSDSCKDFLDAGRLGSGATAQNRMCSYCRQNYVSHTVTDRRGRTSTVYEWSGGYSESNCLNINRRCAEKQSHNGTWWRNDSGITICSSDNERPQCREYNRLVAIAEAKGYTSDANSEPKPQTAIGTGDTGPAITANADGWFNRANKVQKMKWAVARTIRNHVEIGGFLFAQCFAPESLDISLWQAEIHDGAAPADAYDACFALRDFDYRRFPIKSGVTYYSTINYPVAAGSSVPFGLTLPLDPCCQNHGSAPDTGSGHTCVFRHPTIKDDATILGNRTTDSAQAKYIKGQRGTGKFAFLGGHYHHNTESKRLVLNNILLGSLVDKQVTGDIPTGADISGRQKSSYGCTDPDNSVAGGANDYRDRFMYGFNGPIEINDRLIAEHGNMRGPTDQAVDFRVYGDETASPSRRVIVPITDVGPEIAINNPQNADALTVYDMQG